MRKKVLLSGMQPSGETGMLHLGNYEGALKNWVRLQNSGEYEMYCCIVDWHSLTSDYKHTKSLNKRILNVAADYIASGLDPEKSTIFLQSLVKEHAELHLLLSMIVPIPWLERVPSYKQKSAELGLDSFGFLGYPLLMAADIMVYKGEVVPVGKDQAAHLEFTREVVRRFNSLYGELFPEPQPLWTKVPVLLGTDGRKMSKSYNNHISLGDPQDVVKKKILSMFTDPDKIHRTDPGHPDRCPVYLLHKLYNPEHEKIYNPCISGSTDWGCVRCKKLLTEHLLAFLEPIRKKREELLSDPGELMRIIASGADKAREKASATMREVRTAMHMLEAEL